MKRNIAAALTLALLPQVALAQNIPGFFVLVALVPLVNLILAISYSVVRRSGLAFLAHTGLTILWVCLFWFFASNSDSDFLAWAPIGISLMHSIYLVWVIARRDMRR